jgi:cytochrome P450
MSTTSESPGASQTTVKSHAGPRGHWLWGCLGHLRRDPLGLYSQARREYGDYVRLRIIPGVYGYLLTHPDAVEHVLQKNHKNYRKLPEISRTVGLVMGNGLFTNEGDSWLQQRRLAQPAFNRQQLARLSPLMVEAADAFVRQRQTASADQPFDILGDMMKLSLRIASTTLFSTDISGEADAIGKAFRAGFAYVGYRLNSLLRLPLWLPTPRNLAFARAKKLLDRVVLDMIEARRRSGDKPADLLTMLLAGQDEETGVGMSDQQLKDEVLTLLTAGHETVGAALAWTWYLLGQHPQVQNDLADEVCGRLQGRTPTIEDLAGLPLVKAVFEEAMRLYPPAWGTPRQAIDDDEINRFTIPAKATVAVLQFVTHRHPDFWDDPEKFKPERFLPGQATNRHKFAYFPFGGGPRVCIGNTFAMLEGPLVLATIIQKFRVELVPGHPVVPDPTFTLRPKYGMKVRLLPR